MRTRAAVPWVLIGVGAAAVACAERRPTPVMMYKEQLRPGLILSSSTGKVGDIIQATYFVENTGPNVIDACFGKAKGYDIVGSKAAKGHLTSVDHPTCESRFRLEPGQKASAELAITVLEVGVGPARVSAWVELVDPTRCDRYGCDAANVPSTLEQLLTVTATPR